MKKTTQAGRSMVEMLGVLAIVGVLSVAGIAGYSMAMNKYKVSRLMDEIQLVGTNIRTLYASQGTYNGLSASLLFNVQVLDNTQCPDNCTKNSAKNAFGGTMAIAAATPTGGTADTAFTITYSGIPKNACINLATTGWGGTSSGMISLQAGKGTAVTAENLPISILQASTDCANEDNTLVWTMR
jgi:type II secretory pathway pseudopilin PulG